MTRDEAVEHIWYLSEQVAGEFARDDAEWVAMKQRTREALAALGVDC